MFRLRGEIYREIVITDDALLAKIAGEFGDTQKALWRDLAKLGEAGRTAAIRRGRRRPLRRREGLGTLGREGLRLRARQYRRQGPALLRRSVHGSRRAVLEEVGKLRGYEESVANGFVRDTQSATRRPARSWSVL